jgi:dipeptidyl aminopeptidase/acylaminoacyl peptidase
VPFAAQLGWSVAPHGSATLYEVFPQTAGNADDARRADGRRRDRFPYVDGETDSGVRGPLHTRRFSVTPVRFVPAAIARRSAVAILVAALAVYAPQGRAAAPSFSLDSILSAPFVDDLTASPRRDALTWTVHERGARNVAVWKDGSVREITHCGADDGQELAGVQFLTDSTAVVYERGGTGSDGDKSNPNPAAPAKREPRKILLTSLASGATIELGRGRNPAVSPMGDRVAWIDEDQQVSSATLSTKDGGRTWSAGKAATLLSLRGSVSSLLWSPDGTRIALTNNRGDHSYIAIYALGASNVTFAAPAFSSDQDPVWSPDGSKIAFVRLPGDILTLSYYDDASLFPPWSIVVADAATGEGRIVWQAPRGRGHEFNVADDVQPLWWSRDGRLAFIWERDGWRHLYSMSSDGGSASLLTPGAYDIEQIALGADGNELLYTSNEGDLDSRHVWRIRFAGGERKRVTGGATNQWSPVELVGGKFAYIDASFERPGTVMLADGAAATALIAQPPPLEYPAALLVRPKAIVFKAPDGLTIHAQVFLAHDGRAKHPALIFVHGGPERQMLTTFHYYEPYANLYELNQYLVSRGFDVLSVNYRGGIMYGHDFFEPPQRGPLGASEYLDVLAGAHVLAARPDVDPKRIGIYGLSYGGYLTALALARNSDVFATGADQAGWTDWTSFLDSVSGRRVGTSQQRALGLAASPLADITKWKSPVYLDQGDDDREVPFSQAVTLAGLLEARGVDVTLHAVPDEVHEYDVYAHELDRFQRTADFLAARLRAR